jgi:hypothetical protein
MSERQPEGKRQPSGAAFEFENADNATLHIVGSRASLWGLAALLGGGASLLTAIVLLARHQGGWGPFLLAAGAQLAVGPAFLRVGRWFDKIVDTQGHDISHLLAGVARLTRALRIQMIVALVVLAAAAVMIGR